MSDIIKIEHLNKCFGDVKAVNDLSFRVKKGELFAFLGVNGAGKSTTISIICGQLRKDSGNVWIKDKEADRAGSETKRLLGVVFQDSVLDKPLTVKENLKSRAALYGITGNSFEKRLAELVEILDFGDYINRPVGKLSGGQRRRIDIARALIHRPEILILDEPTTGLDPQTRLLIWNVIERLRTEENMTVFLTTHYMEEAASAGYVVILDKGSIVAEGTPLELKNEYVHDTISLYGVTEDEIKALETEYKAIRDGYRKRRYGCCISCCDWENIGRWSVMKEITALVSRNRKLFFKDKGMLFSSMITPVILIVLYATFLANVYKDSFVSATKDMIDLPDKIINGTVAAQLAAALLAVSCVTVTFCVNLTMVQDRASGARKDFDVSPVSKTKIYIGYFLSTVLNSLMVNGTALALCLLYILKMGWYMSASDVIFVILDMILLVLFGSTLSSIVSYPLKTQGQLSAVGTIVSAGYGFVCGAYMPISNFSSGLQKALSYLPGTYGTSLVKNHMLNVVYKEMADTGLPSEAVTVIRNTLDCNPVFMGHVVGVPQMYLIMAGSIVVFGAVHLLIIMIRER